MKSTMTNRSAGFTLIELMIVVSIIGILASIAVPAYQDYITRSKVVEALELAMPHQRAVVEYYERWGRMPADNAAAGMDKPSAWQGKNVTSITIKDGAVAVVMSYFDGTGKMTFGPSRTIFLRPAVNIAAPSAPVLWVCNAGAVPNGFEVKGELRKDAIQPLKHLPATCR